MSLPVRDLVDADAGDALERVAGLPHARRDALEDCAHSTPRDSQQTGNRRLVRAHRQPREPILEHAGELGLGPRPRDTLNMNAVPGTPHAWRLCPDVRPREAEADRAPPPPTFTSPPARAPTTTLGASTGFRLRRPHPRHEVAPSASQPTPSSTAPSTPSVRHITLAWRIPRNLLARSRQPNPEAREVCALPSSGASTTYGFVRRS